MRCIKITPFLMSLLLLVAVQAVHAQGIEFEHGSWEEVKAKAQKENKPIFVDAYTSWCGPCKWMAKNVFTQEEVGTYFKNNFIAYKMDMEKGEGPAFAKTHSVQAYPTLLYFAANGDLIHKGVGARDAEGLLGLCNDALDPKKQLVGYTKKYNKGTKDKTFLGEYLEVLMSCGEDITEPFEQYWKMIDEDEKKTKEALDMMANASGYFSDFKNPYTEYFLKNKETYRKVADEGQFSMALKNCYIRSLWGIARNEDKKAQKSQGKELLGYFPERKPEFKKHLAYLQSTLETPPNEAKVAKNYAKYLAVCSDWSELNSAAWNVYEESDDVKEMKQALGWINRSIELNRTFFNVDTKGALLFRLKEYEEAKELIEEAVKLGEEAGFSKDQMKDSFNMLGTIKAKLDKTASN